MRSGKTSGWRGQLDRPSTQRYDRPRTPDHAWTPSAEPAEGQARDGVPVAEVPSTPAQRPELDPMADTMPVGGLHKFDLGMVPASVTPPRSWRRAGWFAIGTSGAALCGLLIAGSVLTDPTQERDSRLPSMPGDENYSALPYPEPDGRTHPNDRRRAPVDPGIGDADPNRKHQPTEIQLDSAGTESDVPAPPSSPHPPEPAAPVAEPDVAAPSVPGTDARTGVNAMRSLFRRYPVHLGDATRQATDELPSGTLRSADFAAFPARYAALRSLPDTADPTTVPVAGTGGVDWATRSSEEGGQPMPR